MTAAKGESEFYDPDVVNPGLRYYVFLILVAVISLGAEIGLWILFAVMSASSADSSISNSMSTSSNPLRQELAGTPAIWKSELWTFTCPAGSQNSPGIGISTFNLRAIDLLTGTVRDTGLTLSVLPYGLQRLNDELWAVTRSSVHKVQSDQLVTLNPRRLLIHPTAPFVYRGQLAVIDRDRMHSYSLLTLTEGEWSEVMRVEIPSPAFATLNSNTSLRVVSNNGVLHLFYREGGDLYHREGIIAISEVASALSPENKDPLSRLTTGRRETMPPGWKTIPVTMNWVSSWDAAFIGDNLRLLSYQTLSNTIEQFPFQNGAWQLSLMSQSMNAREFALASGWPAFLVTSDLDLYSLHGETQLQKVSSTSLKSEKDRQFNWFLLLYGLPYLAGVMTLILGTTWLMRTHCRDSYVYGKRQAIQASLIRRAIARAIDIGLTVVPIIFFLKIFLDRYHKSTINFGRSDVEVIFPLVSVLGTGAVMLLIYSVMEGLGGVTPGKWLCGIRTFRTTLRPCGILRALTRELVVALDGLMLFNWIPGVMSIAMTAKRQRLGDLAADTIVVLNPRQADWLQPLNRFDPE